MLLRILGTLRDLSSAKYAGRWALALWLCDLVLTLVIVRRVPYTNIDWEAYMEQVDGVLAGEHDYARLRGPTGPIAYPAGFCYFYGALRWLQLSIPAAQVVFAALYMATLGVVFEIYRRAGAPGWLFALCVLSKRTHSVFVLRLFNDGVATLLLYVALLLLLGRRHLGAAVTYSLAVSVKMHPLLYSPAVGLCLVLEGGWSLAAPLVLVMVLVQLLLAAPFLAINPTAYFMRAFGGPGDLQHAWSVNWRMLPEAVFEQKAFALGLLLCHLALLAGFAHCRWTPRGLFDGQLWRWIGPPGAGLAKRTSADNAAVVALLFGCNFLGVACLRTMHFQFVVWYWHCVPFLAWYAVRPDRHAGDSLVGWALRCGGVVCLTLAVEVPFLLTTTGAVRGPDGRVWTTAGVPTRLGSAVLLLAHGALTGLLALRRRGGLAPAAEEDEARKAE